MNKELINSRFAKTLSSYDENAKIQKRMAQKLIDFLPSKSFNSILEIGCGTGFLTKKAVEKLEFKNYKAVDIVGECAPYIMDINPDIEFINADIENQINRFEENFDLIISNAALQWTDNFEKIIKNLHSKLNPNGILLFSTFGKENFREIYHVIGTTLKYHSTIELNMMFSLFSPHIEEEIHIMSFSSPKEVLKHLQLTGVNAIENRAWTKKDLLKFEHGYNNLCSGRTTLTYNPIYIKIKK